MNDVDPEKPFEEDAEPEVFAIKRRGSLWELGRRGAMKTLAAGAGAAATGCREEPVSIDTEGTSDYEFPDENDNDDDDPPVGGGLQFESGGKTYRIVDLGDYNGGMPAAGTSLFVIGHVKDDYFFREFDSAGSITLNAHESRLEKGNSAVANLKSTTNVVETLGKFEDYHKENVVRFANEISTSLPPGRRIQASSGVSSGNPGRRMQGAAGQTVGTGMSTGSSDPSGRRMQSGIGNDGQVGRRMQGTASSTGGRRMQGAGNQFTNDHRTSFGDLTIGTKTYQNVHVQAVYTDGTCKIEHSGGTEVVQTAQLSELVRLQLPAPVPNPAIAGNVRPTTQTGATTGSSGSGKSGGTGRGSSGTGGTGSSMGSGSGSGMGGSTTPSAPTSPPSPQPRPSSPPSYRSYSYHYWRPN